MAGHPPPRRKRTDPGEVAASISLLGNDRRGVVARVTQFLFENGANIESLEEQVSRGVFHMSLVASWKATPGRLEEISRRVRHLGAELGMETRVRFHRAAGPQRIAVLATKEAHCLEAVLGRFGAKGRGARTVVVVSNRQTLAPLAREARVPFAYVPWNDRARAEKRLLEVLDRHDVDFLVLARFMKILSPDLCWRYRNRIINVHPSLLPAFPGAQAYRQAWEKGVRVIGATAHFVTPDLDQGPIIAQRAFNVSPTEELDRIQRRGREVEADVLLEAVRLYLDKRLDVHWGRVWTE